MAGCEPGTSSVGNDHSHKYNISLLFFNTKKILLNQPKLDHQLLIQLGKHDFFCYHRDNVAPGEAHSTNLNHTL